MEKIQSKNKDPKLDLKCKDWKYVESKDPSLVEPLNFWIKQYGFEGQLQTSKIQILKGQITQSTKNKDKKKCKQGWVQLGEWEKSPAAKERGSRQTEALYNKREQDKCSPRQRRKWLNHLPG